MMAMSLGIWAERAAAGGTLYRWEGDQGEAGRGYVLFEAVTRTIRPADSRGEAIGTFQVNGDSGEVSGSAEGFDRAAFMQVAASILRAYAKSGEVPATAHAYFG